VKRISQSLQAIAQGVLPYYQHLLDPFFTQYPYWALTFYLAIGLYGTYMALKQEEVNEIVEFIQKNPEVFSKQIVESEEFQKGFLVFFEQYLKQRSQRKKEILKKIITGFANEKEKEAFELERLNDCLVRISLESLEYIVFLDKEILPIIEKQVQDEISKMNYKPAEKERILQNIRSRQSISDVVLKWLYDRFNFNSPLVKEKYNLKKDDYPEDLAIEIANIEQKETLEKTRPWEELVSLGIMRMTVSGGAYLGGGAGSNYSLTAFGLTFIKYALK
jgi:hypothetical protein